MTIKIAARIRVSRPQGVQSLALQVVGRALPFKTPAMAAGVTDKLWEVSDIVTMLEQWELANFKPEYQFVVRQYAIGKGHSVSVLWRGGEVDSIFGFDKEADALG